MLQPYSKVEELLYDLRAYRTTGKDLDSKIIVAGVDEFSMRGNPRRQVKGLGRWPWPRQTWALFLRRARELGVRLVVFDILFSPPESDDSQMASESAKGPPTVFARKLLGRSFSQELSGTVDPSPVLMQHAAGVGFINVNLSQDRLRSFPLVAKLEGQWTPSLDLAALSFLSKSSGFAVTPDHILLGKYNWPTVESHEFLLRWSDPYLNKASPITGQRGLNPNNYISVLELFNQHPSAVWQSRLLDSILIVGAAEPSLQDHARTPVGILYGATVHAHVVNALLHESFYRKASLFTNLAFLVFPSLLLSFFIQKRGPFESVLLTVLFILGYGVFNFILFNSGVWADLAHPWLAMGLIYLTGNIHQRLEAERKRREISKIYGRYLAPQVRKELLEHYEDRKWELQGALREVTVLESDIRGFTHFSEDLPAQEVVGLLNVYFTAMIPILYKHGGTWDKFAGDALLAYFGAPGRQDGHAGAGVACALEMLQKSEEMRARGEIPFQIGIGLHSGIVKVGHIGADSTETSEEQKQFTIIGDTVNLASRLCSMALPGTIYLSEATAAELKQKYPVEPLGPILMKGKSHEVNVFKLCGQPVTPPLR